LTINPASQQSPAGITSNAAPTDADDLPKDLDVLVVEYGNAPMFGTGRTRRIVMQDIYRSAREIFESDAVSGALVAGYQMLARPEVFYPASHRPTDIDNFRTLYASPAGAQVAMPQGWIVERVGEAMHIKRADGRWTGFMPVNGPAQALTYEFLSALDAATPSTAPPVPFGPVVVVRDETGFWSHPGIPKFDEDQEADYRAWIKEQGLDTKYRMLCNDMEHPLYEAWFERGEHDMSCWTPTPPAGEGWFTISIHDTVDGPIWIWARRNATKQPVPNGTDTDKVEGA
jgi:hypothetical protein